MALKLITAPSVTPVSLVEAKSHLRVIETDEDDLITIFIKAATDFVDGKDGFLGRALVTQTWELVLDEFPDDAIQIPLPPLQSIVSIKYDDTSGTEQTLATDQYSVDTASEPGWVAPISSGWPATIDAINSVRIRFIAGYAADANSPDDPAKNVPSAIKSGMLLHIGSLFANRETVVTGTIVALLPFGAEQLFRPYRVQLGMA